MPPSSTDPEEFKSILQTLVRDSYALLADALDLSGLNDILTEEYFSRTVGMFEQNNVGIRYK